MSDGLEALLREHQFELRKTRCCIDQIYSLRSIIHNMISLEYKLPLYVNFVDFKAAFDSTSGTGQGDRSYLLCVFKPGCSAC